MEIQERLALSFAGGGFAHIPPSLVHVGEHGVKFLKLQGSHPAICKLLCGKEVDLLKTCRNPSFAGSQKLAALKEKVQESLKKSLAGQEGDPVFEEAGESGGSLGKTKKGLPKLENAPETITLDLYGVEVEVLAPNSWKSSDVFVKLESTMLDSVFKFLNTDCHECFSNSTRRSYQRSGAFKRKAGE